MTNDETIMTKEFSNVRIPDLGLWNSSFFGHSDLEIGHFSRGELRQTDREE
jgi:hypothetical protein